MKRLSLLLLVLFFVVLTSQVAAEPATRNGETSAIALLVKGNNAFAVDLYAKLRGREGNLFFSPYSISTALGMVYAGAKGETAKQMAQTLHLHGSSRSLNRGFKSLIGQLNRRGKNRPYQLEVANSLWRQKGVAFLANYLKLAKTSYQAEVRTADFQTARDRARRDINAWVSQKTQGRIKDIFQPGQPSSLTRLILINAIYFKSRWEAEFVKEATKEADFRIGGDKKIAHVPMMNQLENFRYFEGGKFQLLGLPYKRNELQMVILLPKAVAGLDAFEKGLTAAELEKWLKAARLERVQVTLPKFKFRSDFNLREVLSDMGMPQAFSQGADFARMLRSRKLQIGSVVHKAYVDVHEKGTEAAAVTKVEMQQEDEPNDRKPKPPVVFKADHPFVFLIRHEQTGSILFMGRVTNPLPQ